MKKFWKKVNARKSAFKTTTSNTRRSPVKKKINWKDLDRESDDDESE